MDEFVKWLKKTHHQNWIIFCVSLGIVNLIFFRVINSEYWNYSICTNNPFFLGLEIFLTAIGVTRILVTINITFMLHMCPIIRELIWFFDYKKRNFISKAKHIIYVQHGIESKKDYQILSLLLPYDNAMEIEHFGSSILKCTSNITNCAKNIHLYIDLYKINKTKNETPYCLHAFFVRKIDGALYERRIVTIGERKITYGRIYAVFYILFFIDIILFV